MKKEYKRQRMKSIANMNAAKRFMKAEAEKNIELVQNNKAVIKTSSLPKLKLLYLAREASDQGCLDKLIEAYEQVLKPKLLITSRFEYKHEIQDKGN
jgi:hypothetical protein|tara:strand:- start:2118 stop:2408 length:291 start_codon:yes stop_codon:yes gene_type:complete